MRVSFTTARPFASVVAVLLVVEPLDLVMVTDTLAPETAAPFARTLVVMKTDPGRP